MKSNFTQIIADSIHAIFSNARHARQGYTKTVVVIIAFLALFVTNVQAQSANALKFDPSLAVNDNSRLNYVGINNPFTAYQNEITVEFWMYAPSANLPFGSVMGQGNNNDAQNIVWLMHPNTDGTMTFFVNDGNITLRSATINIIAGSWHHYAGVANATSTKFYIDGVLMNTGSGISTTVLSNPASVIHIGKDVRYATRYVTNRDPFNRYATMTIDEVRIWSRALCEQEINNNKNCELFNPTGQNKLENYFNFNQGIAGGNNATVTTVYDQSGKNRNGTLYNFTLDGPNSNWVTSGSTNNGTCAPFVAGSITGNTSICVGAGTTLSNSVSGGTWSSSAPGVASVNSSGLVTGLSAGTTTISYTIDCGRVATATVTVNALPTISAGSNSAVCQGFTLNLSSSGGVSYVWTGPNDFNSTSQNPSLSNIVSGAAGTYSVKGTGANGCKNDATVVVTVNTLDSDGDGIPDACDDDADNDGIPNVLETNKSNFFWSTPPTVSGNTATGTINKIAYTYTSSSSVTTTPGMYGIGNFPSSYGVPNANPTIQNTAVTNNTITFASPMTNPVLVFASIGQAGLPVPISFGADVEVVWSQNVIQNSPTQITGTEGYAIVRMMGTFSSISFTYLTAENYCNFAFGADFQGDTDGDGIPDYLDTDSDNDGCPDAIEGSMGFSLSQTSNGRLIGGVDSRGIPLLAGNGQGIGTSENYVINCFCQPGLDKTSPTVITKNIPVNLDAAGNATITAAQVNNGSTDNCSIKDYSLDKTTFSCSNLGANTVTLTVTDNQGNVGTATATVTVTDNQVPNVVTQNVTVYLDNNGHATLTAAQVNNGSSDNCGIATMTVSPSSFSCVDKTVPVTTNTQTIISDNTWQESVTTYSTPGFCSGIPWAGVTTSLPLLSTYTVIPTINAYYLTPIPGTQGLFGLNGVRFFRKTFNLSSLSGIKATLLAAMDNGVQIFINGVAVAFQGKMNSDGANFNGLYPDRVILNSTGGNVNGGVGFHSYDNITNANASSLFVVGTNEIVLALANCDGGDRGAITFKAIIENNVGGPGTVVLTVTDASENSASANALVTVVDAIKPVIICPNNMDVDATSTAGAVVTYDAPVATDNCSVVSIVMTGGRSSGSTFPIGTTTVTYRAKDASGNFTDCSFTVTVKGLLPVINCPEIRVSNTPGLCGANVNFAATETTGIPASTITYSIQPGTSFGVGTTIVTATATNAIGSNSCSFNVTVVDNQAPVIGQMVGNPDPSNTTSRVNVFAKNADVWHGGSPYNHRRVVNADIDGDGDQDLIYTTFNSQMVFRNNGKGVMTGEQLVSSEPSTCVTAGDVNGDGSPDIVLGYWAKNGTPQSRLYLNDGHGNFTLNVSNLGGADRINDVKMADLDGDGDLDIFFVGSGYTNRNHRVYFNDGLGHFTASTQLFNTDDWGVSVVLRDFDGNGSIDAFVVSNYPENSTRLWLNDGHGNFTAGAQNFQTGANVADAVDIDNDGDFDIAYATGDAQQIKFLINNGSGIFTPSTQSFSISGNPQSSSVKFVDTDMDGDKDIVIAFAGRTQQPVIFLNNGSGSFSLGNSIPVRYLEEDVRDIIFPDMDGDGDPDFVDASYGWHNEVLFNQLTHPTTGGCADITRNSEPGKCGATVTYSHTVTDNCSATISYIPASGSFFPVGTTPVTATAVDPSNNKTTCTFNVIVLDNIPPVISCPANISEFATSASGAVITYATPVGTDNCSGVTTVRTGGFASGSTFPIGTTTVTYRATDASGNFTDCSFTVTVKGLAPVINCPDNISAPNTPGVCGANVGFVATETTGIPASTITYSIAPGSFFTVGTTTVTATATNAVGKSICSFTVTVTDTEIPVITSNGNKSVNNDPGKCGAVVTVSAGAKDNCGVDAPSGVRSDELALTDAYPVGTTTITWSVKDIHGNPAVPVVQTVVVTDNEIPVITSNGDKSVNNELGKCGATVAVSASAKDNCGVGEPAGVRSDGLALNDAYPVGTTTIKWTVTDMHGNPAVPVVQTIVVTDNEIPVITSSGDKSVNNDPGKCGATVVVSASAKDNCGVGAPTGVRSDGKALIDLYPVGPTTIIWNVTDKNGNAATSVTQTIVVTDNEIPVITSNGDKSVNNDPAKCGAAVTVSASAKDNCGVGAPSGERSDALALTAAYPVGTTTITWTVTDIHGNAAVPVVQKVVVTDNEKPVINCPANQVFCANVGGVTNYAIPALTAFDNCGIATTTYAVTGATTRSGLGNDASGTFAIGVSTITWTVTDIHQNVSTCSFTVTINPLPVASITSSNADAFCNKLSLTGNSTLSGQFSYQWLYAGSNFMSTQVINLGLPNGDGVYSLYTTDGNGCRSELAATYTYQKQNLINSYTLLGFKGTKLGRSNTVQTGSVGVASVKGKAEMGKAVSIASAGAFLKAVKIDIEGTVNIPIKIYAAATPVLPTMIYNTSTIAGLGDYKMKTAATVTLPGNYNNVYIKKGSNVTLSGSVFGNIKIERGAQVNFTSAVVNIYSLSAGSEGDDGQEGNYKGQNPPTPAPYTTVKFAGNAQVLVKNKVDIGSHTLVNPNNYKVTFYVGSKKQPEQKDDDKNGKNNQQGYEGQDQDDESAFTVSGSDAKVISNVYIPYGKLMVNGNDNDYQGEQKGQNENTVTTNPTYMTGLFIANSIMSESKGVIWNSYDCSAPAISLNSVPASEIQSVNLEKVATAAIEEELKVTVMPNPSSSYFTLKLVSKSDAPVQMKVVDAAGRVLEARSKIGSNSTIQVGHNFSTGTYFAEMIQGTKRIVVQLVKIK